MSIAKRKSLRFKSTPLAIATLDTGTSKEFKPSITALVANESYTGCALVLVSDINFKIDQSLKIKIADLTPIGARIVWSKTLEENIKKIGLEFKE